MKHEGMIAMSKKARGRRTEKKGSQDGGQGGRGIQVFSLFFSSSFFFFSERAIDSSVKLL